MIRGAASLCALVLALVWLGSGVPAAAADDHANLPDMAAFLKEIGKSVSDFTTLKTEFVQEKEMAMFKEKLVIRGRIFLQKPNKVAWHVDSPVRYSVLITDKLIRQWDEDTNKVQEISLVKNPVFQTVLNQLTVWFSGDYSSLLTINDVRKLQNDPVVLEFVPLQNNPARKVIKSITITFREDRKYLKQIRIREQGGDVTSINFNNTLMNVPLDKDSFEVRPAKDHADAAAPGVFGQRPADDPDGVALHG
jgi:outer membrane lipoprotein-sorting protein